MGFVKAVAWFKELSKKDIGTAGGKGANLAEIMNAGFPVPPGFMVTVDAFFDFLEKNQLMNKIAQRIDSVDIEDTAELQKASEDTKQLVLGGKMPETTKTEIKKAYLHLGEKPLFKLSTNEEVFVAVRSSATAEDLADASFAGQQETFLNIVGMNRVLEAVQKCWASLYTARAIYYRKKKGFETRKVGIAVAVQKMVESEVSGIMFTVDPTTNNPKHIMIEAALGLGEAIVSGSLTPDTYLADKEKDAIIDRKIAIQKWKLVRSAQGNEKIDVDSAEGQGQKLDDKHIMELEEMGKMIEEHYGKPQDIEWALEKKKLYIIQSRAITTLGEQKKSREKQEGMNREEKESALAVGMAASPGVAAGKAKIILDVKDAASLQKGEVLVTKMTSPDWVSTMQKSAGIVTDEGGATCHAAIVSRELGIPCVVGTGKATQLVEDGETITVDGSRGIVFRGEKKITLKENSTPLAEAAEAEKEAEEAEEKVEKREEEIEKQIPVLSGDSLRKAEESKEDLLEVLSFTKVKVKVNVAIPSAAEEAAKTGAKGVGLLRAEHMITSSGKHPAEFLREGKQTELVKTIKDGIRSVAEKFPGKPVEYRTFDARTDEFKNLKGGDKEPTEPNPMLGWHGIRRDLDEPELFKAQIQAVKELKKEGIDNIWIMLPFVQSTEEISKAKKLAGQLGVELGKGMKFGAMIETPASVWIIDDIIKQGVNFISFGTNDLTQLTLGIDRNNERIQKWFTEMHPAILAQCAFVIDRCRKSGIETGICGQAGSNPEMVRILVKSGISSVSANIDAVEQIRKVVAETEKEMLLDALKNKQ